MKNLRTSRLTSVTGHMMDLRRSLMATWALLYRIMQIRYISNIIQHLFDECRLYVR